MAQEEANSMGRLPQDLLVRILSRLPISSLMQFKLMSKAWKTLISSDPLLHRLLDLAQNDSEPGIVFSTVYPSRDRLYWLKLPSFPIPPNSAPFLVKEIPIPPILSCFKLEASCNGFLCLRDYFKDNALHVYNPFTGDHIELPKSTGDKVHTVPILAMGLDPKTRKVKILKMIPVQGIFKEDTGLKCEVKILTIGDNSWRSLGFPETKWVKEKAIPPIVNGNLHWIDWGYDDANSPLISFNLETEEFGNIPIPNLGVAYGIAQVLVFQRCLSVIAIPISNLAETVEDWRLWVMERYGVTESWRQIFRYDFYGFNLPAGVVCVKETRELLLEAYLRSCIDAYDPNPGIVKLFNVGVDEETPLYWIRCVAQVASLNGVQGGTK